MDTPYTGILNPSSPTTVKNSLLLQQEDIITQLLEAYLIILDQRVQHRLASPDQFLNTLVQQEQLQAHPDLPDLDHHTVMETQGQP